MSLYDNWPYTDFSKINLDWIINEVKNYILKYEDLEEFVKLTTEEQNAKIKEIALKVDNSMAELEEYITNNLEAIANRIINELIESGQLYIGTTYNAETEELNIVLSRDKEVQNG